MKTYLLLPQMKIQDANAMSSIYTIGFPAMSAWLGAVHALERKITGAPGLEHIRFTGTAVSCHSCDLQVYRGQGDYRNSIIGTANPLRKKGANFERPPFIEEARIHLSVSLLIEVKNHKGVDDEKLIKRLDGAVYGMKWASGDLIRCGQLKLLRAEEGDEKILGKPVGNDKKLNKCTYVSKYGLDGAKAKLNELIEGAIKDIEIYNENAEFLKDLAIYIKEREK